MVDKFIGMPGSVIKSRSDIGPGTPDQKVDFTDIPDCVNGFLGLPYSYSYGGPSACPGD